MSTRSWLTLTVSTVGACWAGTQAMAYQWHYSPELGHTLVTFPAFYRQHGLYWPWQGLGWMGRWGLQGAMPVLPVAIVCASLVFLLGCLAACRRTASGRMTPPPMTGHGTTVWATADDIRRAGLR